MPESRGSCKTFRDMFLDTNGAREPVTRIFDSADNLAVQTSETIASFFQELCELQQQHSSLLAVALLGTHRLLKIVEHQMWSSSRTSSLFSAVRSEIA